MAISIRQHIKNIERMRVHKDGDAFFVAFDDFVDLQTSPALFIEEEYRGRILRVMKKWHKYGSALLYLTHEERAYLAGRLTRIEVQA